MESREIRQMFFWYLFFLSRSSLKPLPKPPQGVRLEKPKCAVFSQYKKNGERKQFRISKQPQKEHLQKASSYIRDQIFTLLQTSIPYLKCLQQIFTAMKTVTQIKLGNGIELLQYIIRQQEQHQKQGTYSRTIFPL